MPTSDYYFTSIQPDPIIIPPHRANNSPSKPQQAVAEDPIPQQSDTLKPGKTRVYPSMIAEKQVPVLDLTNSTITSAADLQTAFHSLNLCPTERSITWQRKTLHRRRHSMTTYQTVNPTKKLISTYAHPKKRDFPVPLRDQHKPLKQHYHTPLLSVILQSKGDLIENLR